VLKLFVFITLAVLRAESIIYVVYNKDGSITFTSRRPQLNQKYKIFTGSKRFSVVDYPISFITSKTFPEQTSSLWVDSEIRKIVRSVSKALSLEESLLLAIIKAESNFDHRAVSRKGAVGLMQLMPETAKFVGVSNPFCYRQNILGGAKYFKYLLQRFQHNVTLALAAYNAGPERVLEHRGVPNFKETREFIRKVYFYWDAFKKQA